MFLYINDDSSLENDDSSLENDDSSLESDDSSLENDDSSLESDDSSPENDDSSLEKRSTPAIASGWLTAQTPASRSSTSLGSGLRPGPAWTSPHMASACNHASNLDLQSRPPI